MKEVVAFPKESEFIKMRTRLEELKLPFEIINPQPGYSLVGAPAIAMDQQVRAALFEKGVDNCSCSGWVEYRPAKIMVPADNPPQYTDDIFCSAIIMLLAPCMADTTKIRLIAHITGDMTEVFPYLNTAVRGVCYNSDGPLVTLMDQYRMITLYPHKIAIAKADEIVDGWRTLEMVRTMVNDVFARRSTIQPSYEMRQKPPALEIYKRLPRINCGECGQKTCMAFALTLWSGNTAPSECKPIFGGQFSHLMDAFLEICRGLGVVNGDSSQD